jgi:hypothetical protein
MTLPLYVACERDGPLERAGAEVDKAIEDAGNGAERLGNKIDDAIDDAVDELNDE